MTKRKYRAATLVLALAAAAVQAQSRDDFMKQQAYAEMQRVLGQIDVLQNNIDDLARRVSRLESKNSSSSLEVEISALKSAIAELRREMGSQRSEIVKDLSGRIAKISAASAKAPEPPPKRRVISGNHLEYVVQGGDSLYLISKAFNVPVKTIKELNGLKSDSLRVGQKIFIPKVKD